MCGLETEVVRGDGFIYIQQKQGFKNVLKQRWYVVTGSFTFKQEQGFNNMVDRFICLDTGVVLGDVFIYTQHKQGFNDVA